MITCTTKEKVGNGILKKQMAGVVFLFFFFGNAVKKSKILRFKSLMTKEKRDNSFYIFKETRS